MLQNQKKLNIGLSLEETYMIIENKAKVKLKNREPLSMVFLESSYPGTAEVLAIAGCDLICIDNEHGSFTEEQMLNTIRAVHLHEKNVLLRTTSTDPNVLAHYMDLGLDGVFISMLDDANACKRVVEGVKFGPIGKRAVCFNTRASDYAMHGMEVEQYLRMKNENSIIMVNIEKKSAVDDIRKIVAIPEVDAIHTGIWDLASSYGYDGHAEREEVQKINESVIEEIRRAGKPTGYNVSSPADIERGIKDGYWIMLLGGEYNFISAYMRTCQEKMKL